MIFVGFFVFVGFAVIGFAAVMENTGAGQRLTARLLAHVLGEPEAEPPAAYQCCVRARAGRNEAGYWLHRVRDHGEGAA